jgi:hypothetical protein
MATPPPVRSSSKMHFIYGSIILGYLLLHQALPLFHLTRYQLDASYSWDEFNSPTVISDVLRPKETSSWGRDLVEKTYNETFYLLTNCADDERMIDCLTRIGESSHNNTFPWWFRTLLRDGGKHTRQFLHGGWHFSHFVDPPGKMCTIEKVGTKQWRKLMKLLNNASLPSPPSAPLILFLRDPMERLLSAFLDKCESKNIAERNCEPRSVFYPPHVEEGKKFSDGTDLIKILKPHKREFFELYVDIMPLKWNVHVFSLGLYCDGLYRHIQDYDFVGLMGPNFYDDVHRMGLRYGDRMMDGLNKVFDVERKFDENVTNAGVEQSASTLIEEYYTAKTVKRVLEYYAIDYVTLGLEIPEWAQKMLREDAQQGS